MYICEDTALIIVSVPHNYQGSVRIRENIYPTIETRHLRHLKLVVQENFVIRAERIFDYFFDNYNLREAQRFEFEVRLCGPIIIRTEIQ